MDDDWGRKSLLLVGALFFLAALVATAPAALMEWLLPRVSSERLHLQGTRGNLWHGGAAQLLLNSAEGGAKPLGSVAWQVKWAALLKGQLAVDLEIEGELRSSHGQLALGLSGWQLNHMDVVLPMATLPELQPSLKLWQLGGNLELRSEAISYAHGALHGTAQAYWRQASSGLSRLNPFGEYRLSLQDGHLELATLSGPLRLSGKGEWKGRDGIRFDGMAQAEPASKEALQDFLHLFGREQAGGYRIAISLPGQA